MINPDWSVIEPVTKRFDASYHMGDFLPPSQPPLWPMYSYSRPAYMLWNTIGQVMVNKGYSETEIKKWLQSKSPRHSLDGDLGDAIIHVATEWAEKNFLSKE